MVEGTATDSALQVCVAFLSPSEAVNENRYVRDCPVVLG